MKNLLKITTFVIMTLFIYSDAFSQASSDYDRSVDFTKYKTYSYGGWQKDSGKLINDIDKERLHKAFTAEFASRGMTYVEDNGEMVLTLFFVVDKKTSTTAYTNYNGGMGYGGYGMGGVGYRGAGWGWGMGSSTTTYQENDYDVGTFVVDAYDATSKKLIWQGTLVKTLNSNAGKNEKSIPKSVGKLMKKYPIKPKK